MKPINIDEALNLKGLPQEDQVRIKNTARLLIRKRIMLRLIKELGPEESEKLLEDIEKNGMENIEQYAKNKLPDYENIKKDETMIVLGQLTTYTNIPFIGG